MSDTIKFIESIEGWRGKAKEQKDDFLKFAVEYFAFNALLNLNFFPREEKNDRFRIEELKKEKECKTYCIRYAEKWIKELKEELDGKPLINLTRSGEDLTIENIEDWGNIVEVAYRIRNNLFHGSKCSTHERDLKLVGCGYGLLSCMNSYLFEKIKLNSS